MNILLLANAIKQPDDIDDSVNDLIFTYANEWTKLGHRVVVINSESRFPLLFYKVPMCIQNFLKKHGNFTIPSLNSRNQLIWEREGIKFARMPVKKFFPHSFVSKRNIERQVEKIVGFLESISFIPDVVTGHWVEPQLELVTRLGAFYNAKKALVIHGELSEKVFNKKKNCFSDLDLLFFRSLKAKEKMDLTYMHNGFYPKNTAVCFSGIPDAFINDNALSEKKINSPFKFLFVGRLVKYKRIDCTIKALHKAFPDKNFEFQIVGDGPEKAFLEKLCRSLGLSEQVCFLGKMDRDSVKEKMLSSDCFVMVSENEVFGLAYLEAMACGCITIASKDGGVDGIIDDNINGFLCKQGDVSELCDCFSKIKNMDRTRIYEMRNNAFLTVKNSFSDRNAAQNYLSSIINC